MEINKMNMKKPSFEQLIDGFMLCGGMNSEFNPFYEKLVDFIEWCDTPEEHTKQVNEKAPFWY